MLRYIAATIVVTAIMVLGFGSNVTSAQQPDSFQVVIPYSSLHGALKADERGQVTGRDLADQYGVIHAYVGETRCASVTVAGTRANASDLVIEVGGASAPSGCNKEGARVSFTAAPPEANGREIPLHTTLVFKKGERAVLGNILIAPPQTGEAGYLNVEEFNPALLTFGVIGLGLLLLSLGLVIGARQVLGRAR